MISQIIAKNNHRWFDEASYISINMSDNITFGSCVFCSKGTILTEISDIITFAYCFLGVREGIYIEDEKMDVDDFYNIIYNIELCNIQTSPYANEVQVGHEVKSIPQKIKFIYGGGCGCNMGNCSAILDYKMEETEDSKIKSILHTISPDTCKIKYNGLIGNTYYEFPDCVYLYLSKINDDALLYQNNCRDETKKVYKFEVEPNTTYFEYSYDR